MAEEAAEFEARCKELCPHCAAGSVVRQRTDTGEHVHDFASGTTDPNIGFKRSFGHGICHAHQFRTDNKDLASG